MDRRRFKKVIDREFCTSSQQQYGGKPPLCMRLPSIHGFPTGYLSRKARRVVEKGKRAGGGGVHADDESSSTIWSTLKHHDHHFGLDSSFEH
jgi:hypothetical protein